MGNRSSFVLENGLYLAFAAALVATLGSLYFSEVVGYIPCTLCWYQRVLMYPEALLLGMAAVRRDFKQTVYVLPLSVIGIFLSGYHYLVQKTHWFDHEASSCGLIPCNTQYINWLGFVTIPLLAFTAFVIITVTLLLVRRASSRV